MKRFHLVSTLAASILSLPSYAPAAEGYRFYRGIRPLGMGGAGLATVNDENRAADQSGRADQVARRLRDRRRPGGRRGLRRLSHQRR